MAGNTNIEWTDVTWNPVTGCDKVSPGCNNCYALTLAARLKAMGAAHYQKDGSEKTSGPGFGVSMHTETLIKPLRWRKPRKIFVNSMSDLFHKEVTDQFIAQTFAVMLLSPQHVFQVLTKRPARMKSLLLSNNVHKVATFEQIVKRHAQQLAVEHNIDIDIDEAWPLANVWLGVSVEDQKRANLRIPALVQTPAAVKFLSMEPLLGPVDLDAEHTQSLDWVIVGGESGKGARAMKEEWVKHLRDQCVRHNISFHFKQWGAHNSQGVAMSKKQAGRLLEGRTWDQWPAGQR